MLIINKGILAFVNWKCFRVEFDNRVGLERWKHSNYARKHSYDLAVPKTKLHGRYKTYPILTNYEHSWYTFFNSYVIIIYFQYCFTIVPASFRGGGGVSIVAFDWFPETFQKHLSTGILSYGHTAQPKYCFQVIKESIKRPTYVEPYQILRS